MQESKRILLITRNLAMGGIQKNIVDLANNLADKGHDVHLLYTKKPTTIRPQKNVHLHFLDINNINRLTIIGLIYDIFARIILRAIFPRSGFFWRGIYSSIIFKVYFLYLQRKFGNFDLILARGQGAFEQIWLFNHSNFFQLVESPLVLEKYTFLDKFFTKVRFSNKNVLGISTGVVETIKKHLERSNVKIKSLQRIHNPIPIEKIQSLANESADIISGPYIINVARLCPQKDQHLLLRAYKLMNIPHKLVLVGDGEHESSLKKLTKKLKLEDRVVFLGQVDNPYPWMKNADLFVLSSLYEGFGLVLVESLACGTPVVSVDCPGGIRDIMIEELEQNITEYDEAALANMVEYALSNPVKIKENWYMRFDINKISNSFLNLNKP